MIPEKKKLYFDTCIISGISKMDLTEAEFEAIENILGLQDDIEVVTSLVAKQEIENIPMKYQRKHRLTYSLLKKIPLISSCSPGGIGLIGTIGFGRLQVDDKIESALKNLLRDNEDARHIYQAHANKVEYFATVDQKTIISKANEIYQISKVKVGLPSKIISMILGGVE